MLDQKTDLTKNKRASGEIDVAQQTVQTTISQLNKTIRTLPDTAVRQTAIALSNELTKRANTSNLDKLSNVNVVDPKNWTGI